MAEARCRFRFAGQELTAAPEALLGAVLWEAGVRALREAPRSGAPRGMFCAMGVCFECLVRVDGELRRACLVRVREGMQVERA